MMKIQKSYKSCFIFVICQRYIEGKIQNGEMIQQFWLLSTYAQIYKLHAHLFISLFMIRDFVGAEISYHWNDSLISLVHSTTKLISWSMCIDISLHNNQHLSTPYRMGHRYAPLKSAGLHKNLSDERQRTSEWEKKIQDVRNIFKLLVSWIDSSQIFSRSQKIQLKPRKERIQA